MFEREKKEKIVNFLDSFCALCQGTNTFCLESELYFIYIYLLLHNTKVF